eukprot:6457928-Amphidinium_carterae.1
MAGVHVVGWTGAAGHKRKPTTCTRKVKETKTITRAKACCGYGKSFWADEHAALWHIGMVPPDSSSSMHAVVTEELQCTCQCKLVPQHCPHKLPSCSINLDRAVDRLHKGKGSKSTYGSRQQEEQH